MKHILMYQVIQQLGRNHLELFGLEFHDSSFCMRSQFQQTRSFDEAQRNGFLKFGIIASLDESYLSILKLNCLKRVDLRRSIFITC